MQRGFRWSFSPIIPLSVYAEACREIPKAIRYPNPPPSYPDSTGSGNAGVTLYNGNVYAFHSVIYPAFTIPFKFIAGRVGKSADVSFVWANAFFLFLLVAGVVFWMPLPLPYRLAMAILLMYFPGVTVYLPWISPEIFLLTGLGFSLIAYCRKWYKSAILIGALVSWANMAASLLPFFMGLAFLRVWIKRWKVAGHPPWRDGILAFLAGSTALCPMIYNKIIFGRFSIVQNAISMRYITFSRVFDLWFGLDQGLILISFLLPFLFFAAVCYCVKRREWDMLFIAAAAFLLTVAVNANWLSHTGLGISRYLCWIFAPIVFVCFSLWKLRSFPWLLVILFGMSCYQRSFLGMDFFSHNKLAKMVLEAYPALYNPPEDIFILKNCPKRCYCWFFCNPQTVDPYPHFTASDGRVRKIMLTNRGCFVPILEEFVCRTQEEKNFLTEALEKFQKSKKWYTFINIPSSMKISARSIDEMKNIPLPVVVPSEITGQGFYLPEIFGCWTKEKTAKILLPVTPLKQGVFLRFKDAAFPPEILSEQLLEVSSHGRLLYFRNQEPNAMQKSRFFFLPEELMKDGFIELDFRLGNPWSAPGAYDISRDTRTLGFFRPTLEVIPAKIPFDGKWEKRLYQRIAGFNSPEGTGIWSIGQTATIELMTAVNGKVKLAFQILTVPSVKTIKVFYQEKLVALWETKSPWVNIQEICLDIPAGTASIPLSFVPQEPMIPGKVFKKSHEFRNLGVRLLAVEYQ